MANGQQLPSSWVGLSLPSKQKNTLLGLGIILVVLALIFMVRGHATGENSGLKIFGMEIAGFWTVVFLGGLACTVIALCSVENGEFWVGGKLAGPNAVANGKEQHRAATCPIGSALIGGACHWGATQQPVLSDRRGNVWLCECGVVPPNELEVAVAKCQR